MKSEIFNSSFNSDYWITKKLRENNIKRIAFVLTLVLISYHGILHLTSGFKSCKWLLSDGSFHGFGSYRVWQPYGCMLHTYSVVDTRMCFRYIAFWGGRNHIVFLGDSRVRQLYFEYVKALSVNQYDDQGPETAIHHNLEHIDKNLHLRVEFLWQPVVNRSFVEKFESWSALDKSSRPSMIITGSATHSIKQNNASLESLEYYRTNLTILLKFMDKLNASTTVLWLLQDPIKPELLRDDRRMITNEQIDAYNKAAREILRFTKTSKVHVWSSARLIAQGYDDAILDNSNNDGLHANTHALKFSIQILFNLYCNDHMNYNDGTCCSDPEKFTGIQIIVLLIFFSFIVLRIALSVVRLFSSTTAGSFHQYKWTRLPNRIDEIELLEVDSRDNSEDCRLSPEVSVSTPLTIVRKDMIVIVSRLGIVMFYFFLCDRTNFFMKENKYFTRPNFYLPIGYVFALGIFFTDESTHTEVLHRDQSLELRGWMQFLILAYHYTGASQILPIYMFVRLLVSMYLFLSGFGHFSYFWTTGDTSFNRLWTVILRLNFLTICLCLCMNRPYQFYYFVPLITFWYVVMFLSFKIVPRVTSASVELNSSHYFYMILKLVALFSIVSLLYTSEVFFENIFLVRPWKALFVTTDDSIKEWWFRWKIDRYSVLFGMVFAFGYLSLKKHNLIVETGKSYLFSVSVSLVSIVLSLVGLMLYFYFIVTCRNKSECNEIHAYISFIPMVSFVMLRNISVYIRTRFSLLFSWFGKISLELFICQYHTWLAADTHGILVLVPGYPVLNVVITSFIFICIAHEMHQLTEKFVHMIISNDWRYTLRNLMLIFLVLLPVAINEGVF